MTGTGGSGETGAAREASGPTRRDLVAFLVAAVLGCALRWRALKVGLMSDDFMQQGMIDGIYPGGDSYAPFDLYAFLRRGELMVAHIEEGTAPWWAVPELHGTVLRPLASALLWLDHSLFPGRVELWHLHSMLWFAAAIVALGLALSRLLPRSMVWTAVILFACEAGAISPLAWLANRCVLVCATFGFLAVFAHLEWRSPRAATPAWLRGRGGLVVAGLMSLSLAAGEYALGVFAYLLAWELLAAEGPARTRAWALVPALIPLGLYLLVHKLGGYGTFGAEVYADPFHAPGGYLRWASKRLPKLATAGFWSIPGATIHVFRFGLPQRLDHLFIPANPSPDDYHWAHVKLALWGVGLAAVALVLARRGLSGDERRSLRALGVGGFLGLLPIAVAPSHSRLLMIAQLAVCALVAAVLVAGVRLLLGRAPGQTTGQTTEQSHEPSRGVAHVRARGLALAPFVALLAYVHTIGDARWGQAYLVHLDVLQAANIAAFTQGDLLDQELDGRDVVILNGPSQSVGLFGSFVLHAEGWPTPRSWRPLALGSEFPIVANRPAADTLVLSAVQGAWLRMAGELFFRRADQPLVAGEVIVHPSLRVEILADDDGDPTRVQFRFDRSLDDPSLLFIVSTPRGLMRWPVPEVGARNVVPLPRLPSVDDPDRIEFPLPPHPQN